MQAGKAEPGVVLQFSDLVRYGEEAIVSRIVVKTATGSVTLFAFDADQELSEHTAPFEALAQVIEGSGTFIVDGIEHAVNAGQAILLPANVPHAVKAHSRFKMILTMLR